MAITKEKKQAIVASLKERLADSAAGRQTVVFVGFRGLSVAAATALRRLLKQEQTGFTVAKKTLIRRALEEIKPAGELPELPGEVALAYGADAIAPARGLRTFDQENKDLIRILGGIFEGRFVDAPTMAAIAAIPGREALLGQLVNLLNSPIQRFVVVLNQVALKTSAKGGSA